MIWNKTTIMMSLFLLSSSLTDVWSKEVNYSVLMKINENGKQFAFSTFANLDEPFNVETHTSNIEVTLKKPFEKISSSRNTILYKINVYQKNQDNPKKLLAAPKIITELGKSASISSVTIQNDQSLALEFIAQKL